MPKLNLIKLAYDCRPTLVKKNILCGLVWKHSFGTGFWGNTGLCFGNWQKVFLSRCKQCNSERSRTTLAFDAKHFIWCFMKAGSKVWWCLNKDFPMGSSRWAYQKLQLKTKTNGCRFIKNDQTISDIFLYPNPSSTLCGLNYLFMAICRNEIHFAENFSTFSWKGRKNFTSKIQKLTNCSQFKQTTVSDIAFVGYFNIHCKCDFGYKVCYTQSFYIE